MGQTHDDVKFLHFRNTDYLFGTDPRGGVTIAFRPFNPDPLGNIVLFGVARCSEDDNFNKATGRKIASERLEANVVGMAGGVKDEKHFAQVIGDYLYDTFGYTRKFSRKRRSK